MAILIIYADFIPVIHKILEYVSLSHFSILRLSVVNKVNIGYRISTLLPSTDHIYPSSHRPAKKSYNTLLRHLHPNRLNPYHCLNIKMRAKRSKKYRKLMHQYELAFGFREPYQVLGMLHLLLRRRRRIHIFPNEYTNNMNQWTQISYVQSIPLKWI